ncbi:hypothetical protein CROQUDRAFT_106949 [Cronartium quercuum f. sp. fusiforme G11]|uniref:Uncharacterized protein n=1 Tax=Cronartium quercuum f. sp. fusiforme G11 TaxID=708437 RepID=A0A9P6NJC5_9BASI|nr:hypothetical protein CROQUDRAFT_106949 [Cronartium quercuum f. sp. fusiforme G11]
MLQLDRVDQAESEQMGEVIKRGGRDELNGRCIVVGRSDRVERGGREGVAKSVGAEYDQQGRPTFFCDEDREFICALVAENPMLFLDEMREAIYDKTSLLPSLETVHLELTTCLEITSEMFICTDESAICERDLIRVYGQSPSNEPVTRWVRRSNQ